MSSPGRARESRPGRRRHKSVGPRQTNFDFAITRRGYYADRFFYAPIRASSLYVVRVSLWRGFERAIHPRRTRHDSANPSLGLASNIHKTDRRRRAGEMERREALIFRPGISRSNLSRPRCARPRRLALDALRIRPYESLRHVQSAENNARMSARHDRPPLTLPHLPPTGAPERHVLGALIFNFPRLLLLLLLRAQFPNERNFERPAC